MLLPPDISKRKDPISELLTASNLSSDWQLDKSVTFSRQDDSVPFIGALRRWFDCQIFLECERHGVAERMRKEDRDESVL